MNPDHNGAPGDHENEGHGEDHEPVKPGGEPEDDESSTRAVLSDAANPYHRATDRWSKTPMIVALVLLSLVVIFAMSDLIPGVGD
ncbi:hypothetical protein Arth_4246 (plasmid) [Arthrobacter sp. FB24]|uniref:hypothetical protein n=1 Tax=Arthrobacter sp. (strain FB24) TaxID=290399 RepID=UPI00005276AA|nr:hypothetical protein [Arthrobacter sp. FB24]ABK05887.1 hypothetical protein Arth_4246 [Arthrobacter sp. FB24]